MKIVVEKVDYRDVESMRGLYRAEANCQIIGDSILSRGLADPYLIQIDGRIAGYGGVRNKYDVDRLLEFYVLPVWRIAAQRAFAEVLAVSNATAIEAQTNLPMMLSMLYDFCENITTEKILFEDAFRSDLTSPGTCFRPATREDQLELATWVLESKNLTVGSGGFLLHYNPPYGDIFMEVVESERRKGFGSYLVQELKRACYEAGRKPAARCDPANIGSRKTLEKAGLLPCGRLLAGAVSH